VPAAACRDGERPACRPASPPAGDHPILAGSASASGAIQTLPGSRRTGPDLPL